MKTKLIKLPHGGELLYTRLTEINGIQCELHFGCGSWNDEKGKGGTAHFAEHILSGFPTSKKTKEQRYEEGRKYQMSNAATGKGDLVFFFSTTKDNFDNVMDYTTETFNDLVLTEEEFEKEKKVILDELRTRVKTNYDIYYQQTRAEITTQENLRNSICIGGTEQSVQSLTREDVKKFIDKYITLENLLMSVTGNISQKQLMCAVKKYLLPRLKNQGVKAFSSRDIKENYWIDSCAITNKSVEEGKAMLLMLYPMWFAPYTGDIKDEDYCRRIVSPFLREKMHEKLRIEGGLCYACSNFIYSSESMYVCEDCVEVAEENLDKVIKQYLEYLKCLPENIDKDFVEKERKKIIERENFDFERLYSINAKACRFFDDYNILYSSKYRNYDIEQIKKLTYAEINKLYRDVYTQKPFLIIFSNDEKYADKKITNKIYANLKKIKPW